MTCNSGAWDPGWKGELGYQNGITWDRIKDVAFTASPPSADESPSSSSDFPLGLPYSPAAIPPTACFGRKCWVVVFAPQHKKVPSLKEGPNCFSSCTVKVKTRPCCLSPTVGRESNLKKAAPLMSTLVGKLAWRTLPHAECSASDSEPLLFFRPAIVLGRACSFGCVHGRGWVPSYGCCCRRSCSWSVAATADALVTGAVPAETAPVSSVNAVVLIIFLVDLADVSSAGNTLLIYLKGSTQSKTFLKDFPTTTSFRHHFLQQQHLLAVWLSFLAFAWVCEKTQVQHITAPWKCAHPQNLSLKILRDSRGWLLGGYMLNFRGANSQGSLYYQPTQLNQQKGEVPQKSP